MNLSYEEWEVRQYGAGVGCGPRKRWKVWRQTKLPKAYQRNQIVKSRVKGKTAPEFEVTRKDALSVSQDACQVMQEFVAGAKLWDLLHAPTTRVTGLALAGLNDGVCWEEHGCGEGYTDQERFLGACRWYLGMRLNHFFQFVGQDLNDNGWGEFNNFLPLWSTGSVITDKAVALQCCKAWLGELTIEVANHGCKKLGHTAPTMQSWREATWNPQLEHVQNTMTGWPKEILVEALAEFRFE